MTEYGYPQPKCKHGLYYGEICRDCLRERNEKIEKCPHCGHEIRPPLPKGYE